MACERLACYLGSIVEILGLRQMATALVLSGWRTLPTREPHVLDGGEGGEQCYFRPLPGLHRVPLAMWNCTGSAPNHIELAPTEFAPTFRGLMNVYTRVFRQILCNIISNCGGERRIRLVRTRLGVKPADTAM